MTTPLEPAPAPAQGIPTAVVLGALLAAGLAVSIWLRSIAVPETQLDPAASRAAIELQAGAAHARIAQLAAQNDADLGLKTLREAHAERERFEAEVVPLLENADGRLLAASEAGVRAYLKHVECEGAGDARSCVRPSEADLAASAERLAAVAALPRSRLKAEDPSYVPDAQTMAALKRELEFATAARDGYAQPRESLALLLDDAAKRGVSPAPVTLRDAIASLRQAAAREEAVRDAQRQRDAEESERASADAARKRIADEQAADVARRTQLEVTQRQVDFERDKLQQEALAPETLALYSPFLGRGTFRYRGAKPAPEAGLLSYADDIKGFGLMNNFDSFLLVATYRNNKRGALWRAPQGEADRAAYRARWAKFKRYVPIWVSHGKLRP